MKNFILFAVSVIVFSACTKEIKPNLRTTTPSLVIEGNIYNTPGPYTVYLSQSVPYYDSNNVIPVSGGKITISDDMGNRDSLLEITPGTYHTTFILGASGHTYHLSVNSGGRQYDAYSTMGQSIAIDTLGLIPAVFGTGKTPTIIIQNPSGTEVYYNAIMYVNGIRSYKANPRNDQLNNGILQQIPMRTDSSTHNNDTLQAELDVIDQPMYNYWYSLDNNTLSTQTAAPSNPVSNISNNALGYFSAYAYTRSSMIVMDSTNLGYHTIY